MMLKIENLKAQVNQKEILKKVNLEVLKGKVHIIMGPNGAGKSTLSKTIAGHYDVKITGGRIFYKEEDIAKLSPTQRALKGIFLSFQNPIEVPGVTNAYFLRTAVNSKRKYENKPVLNAAEFLRKAREYANFLGMKPEMLNRSLNEGFSGGEKKRNEILQMMMLEPSLVILDEIDSGLDIDALKSVSNGINKMRDSSRSFLIITHYSRVLHYINPDFIHILIDGQIVKTGDHSLVEKLEEEGYGFLEDEK